MATLQPLLGEHLTAITIKPYTLSAGVWTAGSATDMLAYIKSAQGTAELGLADIRPVWMKLRNNFVVDVGDGCALQFIQNSDAANTWMALIAATATKRFLVSWTQGTDVLSMDVVFKGHTYGIVAHDENLIQANFEPFAKTSATTSNLTIA